MAKLRGKEREIIELYESGESINTLATRFKVAPQSIYRIVKLSGKLRGLKESVRLGLERGRYPKHHPSKRIFDYEEAIQLYKTGLSCEEIAEKLGVKSGGGTVWRCLNLAGVIRSMPEAHKIAKERGRWQSPFKLGAEHCDWKGGRRLDKGYVFIYKPEHPRANARKKVVAEHILVWEETHHQSLPKGWVVHHLNGIKDDNRPENLIGLPSKKHALVLSAYQERIRELEAGVNNG